MNRVLRFGTFLTAALLAMGAALAQQTCPAGYPRTTPDSDFADAGNGTVRHIPTGLIWKRCSEGQTWNGSTCTGTTDLYTWQQAFQRADAVNAGAAGTQNAGQTDWRMPNLNELRSITERSCTKPSINLTQFPATPPVSGFWSGSPVAGDSNLSWAIYFDYDYDYKHDRISPTQVRLVRAGQYFYDFDAAVAAPVITSGTPPDGTVGTPYNFTVTATGAAPIGYGATGLPPGLAIDPASGVISGTPTAAGSYNVTVSATNAGGPASANYSIVIAVAAPVITSGTPPNGTVGTPYNFTVTATGAAPIGYGATGLPPGLAIDPASGVISGTPTAAGSYNVTVSATNAGGPASANYSIVIAAAAAATPDSIPTLSEWGLMLLSGLLGFVGWHRVRRRTPIN